MHVNIVFFLLLNLRIEYEKKKKKSRKNDKVEDLFTFFLITIWQGSEDLVVFGVLFKLPSSSCLLTPAQRNRGV